MYQNFDYSMKRISGKNNTHKQINKKAESQRRNLPLTGVSKQIHAANKRDRERPRKLNTVFQNLKGILSLYKISEQECFTKIEMVKIACKKI